MPQRCAARAGYEWIQEYIVLWNSFAWCDFIKERNGHGKLSAMQFNVCHFLAQPKHICLSSFMWLAKSSNVETVLLQIMSRV